MGYFGVFLVLILVIYGIRGLLKHRKKTRILGSNDTLDEKYNAQKVMEALTIDELLDKVSKQGIDSLTKAEKQKLDDYSKL